MIPSARRIRVNQVGYPTDAEKIAIFLDEGPFEVVDAVTGTAVWRGAAAGDRHDEASGLHVAAGDFSPVTAAGRYYLRHVATGERSAEFAISPSVYEPVQRGLLKAFYYFRCGTALAESFAGPWTHGACHLADGIVYGEAGRRLDGSGGWHDAGDYGKYTVPAAKAVADLLLAYECYPDAFRRPLPLPETDGAMPDVLHECRWELAFLLKMQDPDSGGAFHKLTTKRFPPLDRKPEDDLDDLYFMPVSPTATGGFAAVMAMAARAYRPFDAAFANRCLAAALRAWEWLEARPDAPNFKNPPDVATGEYGDDCSDDERYWAAAELYRTTGETRFYDEAARLHKLPFSKTELGWADVGGYGTLALLLHDEYRVAAGLRASLLDAWKNRADQLVARAVKDGFRTTLEKADYIWGSNMLAMNRAMHLLVARRLFGDPLYERTALDQVHYLLGRNAPDISYVTGFGDRAVRDPHYRPGAADGVDEPVPGFVAGGPNANLQDDIARNRLAGKPPALCFADHKDSYSTNEVTIYWNSPAVFVFSHWVPQEAG
jgi:endoglucanase